MTTVIEVSGLTKRFGGATAVDDYFVLPVAFVCLGLAPTALAALTGYVVLRRTTTRS